MSWSVKAKGESVHWRQAFLFMQHVQRLCHHRAVAICKEKLMSVTAENYQKASRQHKQIKPKRLKEGERAI